MAVWNVHLEVSSQAADDDMLSLNHDLDGLHPGSTLQTRSI
jgi:hypothetical protein